MLEKLPTNLESKTKTPHEKAIPKTQMSTYSVTKSPDDNDEMANPSKKQDNTQHSIWNQKNPSFIPTRKNVQRRVD
jgi:hypothetical protein